MTENSDTTVHDALVADLRLGMDVTVAAGRAHVSKQSVYEWLRDGSRLVAAIESGARTLDELGDAERAQLRFAEEAVEAVGFAEAAALGNVVRIARGVTARRVTRKYGPGAHDEGAVPTETIEVTDELPPNLAANVFVLERRFAERWGRRSQLDVQVGAGEVDAQPPSPLPSLLAVLEQMEARRAEVAGELSAVVVSDD